MVEREAQRQQDAALEDATRDARVADRAEQDDVVAAQLVEDAVGQRLTGGVPARRAEVVCRRAHLGAAAGGHGLEDLEPLGHDLGTDPVTGDDREVDVTLPAVGCAALAHGRHPRNSSRYTGPHAHHVNPSTHDFPAGCGFPQFAGVGGHAR